MNNALISFLKNLLPRSAVTQIGTYKVFNQLFGQNRKLNGICVDGDGKPIPWITYPAIEFLNGIDFSKAEIFEFGAGSSTLWWSRNAKAVVAVEREKDWFQKLEKSAPPNVHLILEPNELAYPAIISNKGCKYDVIVIDGAVRYACAEEAIKWIHDDGIIILDNTEWYPQTASMLRKQGFVQIDFSGFCPINAFPSCTSLFFKLPNLVNKKKEILKWAPLGGRWLQAHDDCPLGQIDRRTLKK
jgi:hypothetical protein